MITRTRMITDAVKNQNDKASALIYPNGASTSYGSSLSKNDVADCQYKVETCGLHACLTTEQMNDACVEMENDDRVSRAYVTQSGLIRVNFFKLFADSSIG